jgi:prepilin signal peptidase PulO-like enzyme (type II secretory pathway)
MGIISPFQNGWDGTSGPHLNGIHSGIASILFFLAGLIWGSFLGVVAYRIPQGESLLIPRSYCETCRKTLPWTELIPLKTWVFDRGRCIFCRARLPRTTLLAESLTGIFFALMPYLAQNWGQVAVNILFFSFALPLSIIDTVHRRLPHILTAMAALTGLFAHWATVRFIANPNPILFSTMGYLTGFVPLALISLLRPASLGMGDAFWLGAIGTFVGPLGVIETLLLSTATATAGALVFWIPRKISGKAGPFGKISIPFGPFLSLAGAATLIWGQPLTMILATIL